MEKKEKQKIETKMNYHKKSGCSCWECNKKETEEFLKEKENAFYLFKKSGKTTE